MNENHHKLENAHSSAAGSVVTVPSGKRLLIMGASGLLGSRLMEAAKGKYDVIGTYNPDADGKSFWRLESLDIGSKEEVDGIVDRIAPDIVVLAAAMTNVDACERNPTLANRINASGPALVARACAKRGVGLVHVSTDYVFDGTKNRRYTEDDVVRPISVYGSSKLSGERSVLASHPEAVVARTAVLYGWNPIEGKENFVTWVLKKLRNGEKATLFEDQRVSPTFADDLSQVLLALAENRLKGIWHVSGPDCINRVECGRVIADVFNLDKNLIVSVKSNTVSLPAKRPMNSCLDVSKIEKQLNRKMVPFEEGLRRMRQQEQKKR